MSASPAPTTCAAILDLMRPYYAEDGYPFDRSVAAKVLRTFLRRPAWGRAWAATEGSRIVGYAVVTLGYSLEYRGRDGFLDEIVVGPEWRGRGVGGALVAAAEAFCRRRGVRALHLEVEKHRRAAIGLYRKAGFRGRGRMLLTKVLERRPAAVARPADARMRPVIRRLAFGTAVLCAALVAAAGPRAGTVEDPYVERDVMIPMRDGVRLHTKIFAPRGDHGPLPILMQRTPYGVAEAGKRLDGSLKALADDGYVFVFQDLRGKFGSEGVFVMQRPARDSGRREGARRGDRHLRHDRVAARERPGQQRPRRHARRLLRGVDDDHGRARAAPGARGDLAPGFAARTCGSATTSTTTAPSA